MDQQRVERQDQAGLVLRDASTGGMDVLGGIMSKPWTDQLVSDISDLDNKCFNEMPLTIVIRTDSDDKGERFFDASVFTGFEEGKGKTLVDVIGAESLSELFKELVKAW